jgi:sugar/nucleoside kinase (ribokinase family)
MAPDILFATRREAAVLVGGGQVSRLARLVEIARLVVIKEGAEGSRLLWRDGTDTRELDIATTPLSTDDTTGAGDAFAAGFLFSLLRAGAIPWTAAALRRSALAGHRSAATLLRGTRPELSL